MDLCIEEKYGGKEDDGVDKKRKRQTPPLAAYLKFSRDNRPRILKENPGLEVEGVVRSTSIHFFSMILFPAPTIFYLMYGSFHIIDEQN